MFLNSSLVVCSAEEENDEKDVSPPIHFTKAQAVGRSQPRFQSFQEEIPWKRVWVARSLVRAYKRQILLRATLVSLICSG